MESFEIVRRNMAAVGIDLHLSNQKCPFTIRSVAFLSIIAIGVISSVLYTFCKADSFEVYVDSTYGTFTLLACGLIFTNLILVTVKLNVFLNNFENVISESKKKCHLSFIAFNILTCVSSYIF